MRTILASFLVLTAACSSAGSSSSAVPPASPPAPYLLQFAGEYGVATGGSGTVSRVVLHADGTMQVTTGMATVDGVYSGSGQPGDASANAQTEDGRTFVLSFKSTQPTDVPAQVIASIAGESLVSLWPAGSESMCDATGGTWRDDDPDSRTGLFCTCASRDVYLPSRGGCVAASSTGRADPDRRYPSESAQDHAAGSYEGTGSITSLHVSRDGTYDVTIDGRHDEGTWWEAPSLTGTGTSIDFTGAARAFRAVFGDGGAVTLNLGSGKTEMLRAQH